MIGANSVHARRNAALATAYKLSETALTEYREKVVETIGEKKEQAVHEAIAKDKLEKDPVSNKEIIITGNGDTLCYDAMSGRYFESSMEKLKSIQNDLNMRLINEMYISVNEFYEEIGLPTLKTYDDLGWNVNKGKISMRFDTQFSHDGNRPCIVVDYYVGPEWGYDKY